jgi:hypothetical protein
LVYFDKFGVFNRTTSPYRDKRESCQCLVRFRAPLREFYVKKYCVINQLVFLKNANLVHLVR